jgi:hypothetical protein
MIRDQGGENREQERQVKNKLGREQEAHSNMQAGVQIRAGETKSRRREWGAGQREQRAKIVERAQRRGSRNECRLHPAGRQQAGNREQR